VTRASAAAAVVLAMLLVLAGAASAQGLDPRIADQVRVEWERVTDRPGIEGYVYNDSPYRIGLVRLSIVGRDAPGQEPTSTLAWVYGNVPARGRWPFRVRTPAAREILKVSVESCTLMAREPAVESP
jgi:hypothetical protein